MKRFVILILASVFLQACTTAAQNRQLDEGKRSFNNGDYKPAFHELLPLASEGNAHAQYAVGYMYYYGYGVAQDTESARFWMEKSAAKNYEPARKALQMIR